MNIDQPKRRGRPPKVKQEGPSIQSNVQSLEPAVYMVVQVTSMDDPSIAGVMFQIGAIKEGLVHGFLFAPGGEKIFVTTDLKNVSVIGKSYKTSRTPCSDEWLQKWEAKAKQQTTDDSTVI